MKIKTESGFVVMSARYDVQINSFGASPLGVRRECFLRLIIANDDGVKSGSWSVKDNWGSAIETLEGRTISPEGVVSALNSSRDITRMDLTSMDKSERLASIATVRIPSPQKSLILDLHLVTFRAGWIYYLIQTLSFENTPSLGQDIHLDMEGGFSSVPWAIMTFGAEAQETQFVNEGRGKMRVIVGACGAIKNEPYSPPEIQHEATLLCFMNFAAAESKELQAGNFYHNDFSIDTKGFITKVRFGPPPIEKWWHDYLKDTLTASNDFMKHAGGAGDIAIDSVAAPSLPLEERLAKIYDYVQTHIAYNPELEEVKTLAALLNKGMCARWQAALFMKYLLAKAGIPSRLALIADRESLRFSPLATNRYIFGFEEAVVAEIPGKGPVFMMPGDLALPFGCLPESRQGALAVFVEDDKEIKTAYTPMANNSKDVRRFEFEVTMDSEGNAKGNMTLTESGAPARDFYSWNIDREYKIAHLSKSDKEKVSAEAKQLREALQKNLSKEMAVPGDKVQQEDFALLSPLKGPGETVKIKSDVSIKGLSQKAGDRRLMFLCPMQAGFQNPFVELTRTLPIWYNSGGTIIFDGVIHLPKGVTISDLPTLPDINGPEGAMAKFQVQEKVGENGLSLWTHLEYYQPLVVGYDEYASWKSYQSELARAWSAQCLLAISQTNKDFE